MNSRMGRALPDVPTAPVPLVHALMQATDAYGAGALDVTAFQGRVLELLRADPPREALAPWIERALQERQDHVLARRTHAERDDTIQVIYVAAGEVHPCHCHHNVTSTQVVLTGSLRAREFDRVAGPDPGVVRLRLLFDGWLGAGALLQASDRTRNAHWFAAADEPATLLNFNIRGYETDTFWPAPTRPLGRRMLDATGPAENGLIEARILDVAAAYARFGRTPLDAFPMTVAAAETAPRML